MNKVILTIFIITALVTTANTDEIISPLRSPQHLLMLAEMEPIIFNILEEYSKVRTNRVGLVNEYLEDFKESSLTPTSHLNPSEAALLISKNPIMSYRMIRRYSKMLQNLDKEMTNNTDSEFLRRISSAKAENSASVNWPSDIGLNEAMVGLIRLHQVYDFDLDEFISGNIMGTQTHAKLNPIHCQELGEFAVSTKLYYSGILFLEASLRKVEKSPGSGNLSEIQKSLRDANEAHDLAWSHRGKWDYDFFSQKLSGTLNNQTRKSLRSVAYEENKRKGKQIACTHDYLNYWELCSGKNHQSPEVVSKLFCTYDSKSNPAWVINPLKIEQLSFSPLILHYHDLLGEKTIETLKEESFQKLEHSNAYRVGRVTLGRISTVALLNDPSKVFRRVTRLVKLITGFEHTPDPADDLVVSSYAYGGFFQTHVDWRKMVRGSGYPNDYLATFMFSLEEAEIGGYTVFPIAGVAYKPTKGSAVFWFNLHKNGGTDNRSCHGACPVVIGHKWIASKRPFIHGQTFTRPCGLNPDE